MLSNFGLRNKIWNYKSVSYQNFIQNSKRFNSTQTQSKDRIQVFAELVESSGVPKDAGLKDILDAVWKNEVITSQCPNLIIRLTSLRGEVSKRIWKNRGKDPNDINILAVGTVSAPTHIQNYTNFLNNFYTNSAESLSKETKLHVKDHQWPIGYDLLSKGSEEGRKSVLNLFNEHYNFNEKSMNSFVQNSAIASGGMRGLKDIADACVLRAKDKGRPHRFIQPDNSFGTWWNIIERPEKNDKFRREIFTVGTQPKNKLHLTAQDVNQHYSTYGKSDSESWYITPVGNPSGTKMSPEQLTETCEAISKHNSKAVIILDSVYVRTCTTADANKLFKGVNSSPKLLDQIVFLESFSKSHGLCGERLAMYFSANDDLFTKLHTASIAYSAGPGRFKDHQFMALGGTSSSDKEGIKELHLFWKKERQGLLNYLLNKNKEKPLFEPEQSHIKPEDMDSPCTLYILLKTAPNVKAQDIFIHTGVLGVDTPLVSGHYVRFSLGTLTEPTYSKYA